MLGKGSSFIVHLPIAPCDARAPAERAEMPVVAEGDESCLVDVSASVRAISCRVLVVDDDGINRQVLADHLKLAGFSVVEAADGFAALERLREHEDIKLVLLDLMMPRMSGFEVCRRMRQEHPANGLPIVILTAKTQTEDLVAAFAAGANDYLTKPIGRDELLARIEAHTGIARLSAASERFVPHRILHLSSEIQQLEI